MGQLHELLAIEGDLKGEKEKIKEETILTFSKKPGHFVGSIRRLEMFDEARKTEEMEERQEMITTVPDKLDYMSSSFIRFWDAKLQKETANQEAKGDIIINGVTLMAGLPVTFLLSMEEELKQLRKVYDAIPTLQPGIAWKKDSLAGEHVYKSVHPVIKHKTEKTLQHKIIVPVTKEHPAEVREWSEDKPVGQYVTETSSGMLSPAEKSAMLGKLDKMLRAVKKARQRANNAEIKELSIGEVIFNYIHERNKKSK